MYDALLLKTGYEKVKIKIQSFLFLYKKSEFLPATTLLFIYLYILTTTFVIYLRRTKVQVFQGFETCCCGEKRRKMWKKLYKDVEKNRGVEKIGNADGYDHIFVERITQRSGEN